MSETQFTITTVLLASISGLLTVAVTVGLPLLIFGMRRIERALLERADGRAATPGG